MQDERRIIEIFGYKKGPSFKKFTLSCWKAKKVAESSSKKSWINLSSVKIGLDFSNKEDLIAEHQAKDAGLKKKMDEKVLGNAWV